MMPYQPATSKPDATAAAMTLPAETSRPDHLLMTRRKSALCTLGVLVGRHCARKLAASETSAGSIASPTRFFGRIPSRHRFENLSAASASADRPCAACDRGLTLGLRNTTL